MQPAGLVKADKKVRNFTVNVRYFISLEERKVLVGSFSIDLLGKASLGPATLIWIT